MRVIFFENVVNLIKNLEMQEKFGKNFFCFLDVLRFLTSCFKISVLRGEYFSPKISDITKTDIFQLNLPQNHQKYDERSLLQISGVLGTL